MNDREETGVKDEDNEEDDHQEDHYKEITRKMLGLGVW